MLNLTEYPRIPATIVMAGLAATAVVGQTSWPVRQETIFDNVKPDSTYSSFNTNFTFECRTIQKEFNREIATIYSKLLEQQEPLGAEFEAVWDANINRLYES